MMGLSEIRRISSEATRKARKSKREPQSVAAIKAGVAPRIPFLGDFVPKGWMRTDDDLLFVDISGWGSPGEPALTQDALISRIKTFPDDEGVALIEHGQFQGYVARYKKLSS